MAGTGNVGGAIAQGLKNKGHAVTLGAHDPSTPDLIALASRAGAAVATPPEAASIAEIIMLALPWNVADAAGALLGDLSGRIVVDCMNPLGRTPDGLALTLGHTNPGGEFVQGRVRGAHVVKTLNHVGADMMADNAGLQHRPVMFMAGNEDAAKNALSQLLTDLGFDPMDASDITKSRLLEQLGLGWINQALFCAKGSVAVKVGFEPTVRFPVHTLSKRAP